MERIKKTRKQLKAVFGMSAVVIILNIVLNIYQGDIETVVWSVVAFMWMWMAYDMLKHSDKWFDNYMKSLDDQMKLLKTTGELGEEIAELKLKLETK